jgi:hypothetical protein
MRMAFLPVSVQAVRRSRMSPRRGCRRLLGPHPNVPHVRQPSSPRLERPPCLGTVSRVCHTPAWPVRCRWHTQHHRPDTQGLPLPAELSELLLPDRP